MASKKIWASVAAICIAIGLLAGLIIGNVGGIGSALQGAGGSASKGAYDVFSSPFKFTIAHGWPSLIIGYVAFLGFAAFCAWATWHYDIPYHFSGVKKSPTEEYDSTMPREPEEPERAPQPITPTVEKG
jgi:hypothetical protein